jgi:hypothetical protein
VGTLLLAIVETKETFGWGCLCRWDFGKDTEAMLVLSCCANRSWPDVDKLPTRARPHRDGQGLISSEAAEEWRLDAGHDYQWLPAADVPASITNARPVFSLFADFCHALARHQEARVLFYRV